MKKFKKQITSFLLAGILISTPLLFPSSVYDPVTLGDWLSKNITYKYDKEDYWQSPKETVKLGTADCEDYALLSRYILRKLGYKSYIIAVEYKNSDIGHALTIIRHKDKTFSYLNNQRYISKRFKTVRKLLDYHAKANRKEWKKSWVVISKTMRLGILLWRNKK